MPDLSCLKLAVAAAYLAAAAFFLIRSGGGPRRLLAWYVGGLLLAVLISGPTGHDYRQHIAYFEEVFRSWSGLRRAFFAERLAGGEGLPVFLFYSQWSYLPAVFFRALGVDAEGALKLSFAAAYALHASGAYRLCLALGRDREKAAFCALLYVTANYFSAEYFQRFAHAETWGYAACVWALVFGFETARFPTRRSAARFTLCLAAALVTHPIGWAYFFVGAVFFLGFTLFEDLRRKAPALSVFGLSGAALAAGTAFHWLPIFLERGRVLGRTLDFRQSFVDWPAYFSLSRFYSPGPVISSVFLFCAALLIFRGRERKGAAYGAFAACVAYLFLMNRASSALHVSFLADSQLVWRMQLPFCLFAAALAACLFPAAADARARHGRAADWLCYAAIIQSLVFLAASSAAPVFHARPALAASFERKESGVGISEFLPPPHAGAPLPPAPVLSRGGTLRQERFIVEPPAAAEYRLPRIAAPWLTLTVDGTPRAFRADSTGRIAVELESGKRRIDLRLVRPAYLRYAEILAGILFLLGLWWGIGQPIRGRFASGEKVRFVL